MEVIGFRKTFFVELSPAPDNPHSQPQTRSLPLPWETIRNNKEVFHP